ncbi:hypothetical protein O7542_10200 [Micromonospora sp. WMMC264]|uniref:hypothetical protein n=1 Tax=Micromonospora TaxID=1873 RepID=UPI00083D80D0|nr:MULTISPECIES: hypothetical protein [unclassified Micromonospora]ODB73709.1 hypothetical protein A8711_09280 [Micromonospora sp. II]WBB87493.1 hypothetical protein O7542_10200 [Micromonospora sp. WMMC264]
MRTEVQSPPVVVFLQAQRPAGWVTVARGVPLDGRRCLLRTVGAGRARSGDAVRLVGVAGGDARSLAVAEVSVLHRDEADLVMVSLAGATVPGGHGTDALAVRRVLAMLADDADGRWRVAADAAADVVAPVVLVGAGRAGAPGRTAVPVTTHRVGAATPSPDGDGGGDDDGSPLSWTCRLFGIGCPAENS